MNQEAVNHLNTDDYVYPVSRHQLIFRIRTARKEIRTCMLVYWDRTKMDEQKRQQLFCSYRDGWFDYFQGAVAFSKVARYQKYFFELEDYEGKIWYYSQHGISEKTPKDGFFEYLYVNGTDVIKTPKWVQGAVFYQIFPERFCNGDKQNDPPECEEWGTKPTRENFMGGDLEGIVQKIPYLQELGVECLYLNPVFKGDFNHKYATTDYYRIDPCFGDEETFRWLVKKCHEAGIRIILDGVFNHTGIHFKPFEDVIENQEHSEYADWFYIDHFPFEFSHHDYECVGAYKWMPKLNTAHPKVRKYILDVMDYWIKEYGIDGWRLDVADEVDPAVWEEARIILKEKYPNIFLLGETWGYGGNLVKGNEMDSVMNYMFRDSVRDYFAKEEISVLEFDHRINHMSALYKEETNRVLYNLLDSHDTERFLFFCKENEQLLKMAVAFQMTFLGAPGIYYGDEIGMTGDNDPDCRRCMIWDDSGNSEVFKWYKNLISLRKKKQCLKRGKFLSVLADEQTDTYGYVRYDETESCYVILHKGKQSCQVICPVTEVGCYEELLTGEEMKAEAAEATEFYNGDIAEYKGKILLDLEPYSVKVISKKQEE